MKRAYAWMLTPLGNFISMLAVWALIPLILTLTGHPGTSGDWALIAIVGITLAVGTTWEIVRRQRRSR